MTHDRRAAEEMRVCRTAIKAALDRNLTVSVYDGGAWPVKKSRDLTEIVAALRSTDADEIVFRDAATGDRRGWMHFVYESSAEEVIADCTDNAITREIYKAAEAIFSSQAATA